MVDDDHRTHADVGGGLIVYQCEDKMFEASDDPAEKEFPAKKLFEVKNMETVIDDLKFSPDSKHLAAGSHDRVIDIWAIERGGDEPFRHSGRCKGHSATIIALDWSVRPTALRFVPESEHRRLTARARAVDCGRSDSQLLRSCSLDNEMVHWNTGGKLVVDPEVSRDTDWATWTAKVTRCSAVRPRSSDADLNGGCCVWRRWGSP